MSVAKVEIEFGGAELESSRCARGESGGVFHRAIKSDLIFSQRERQRSDREASAQARGRSPENYLHALLASGPSVFRAIRHGGSLYRGDDEARAASQLHLQIHRWVASSSPAGEG